MSSLALPRICVFVCSAVLLSVGAVGQSVDQTDTVELDSLVVTASRSELPVSHVPSRVTLITSRDIERTGVALAPDAIKKNASIDIIQYPAGGGLSGIGIRGFRPEFSGTHQRTLVLIDGRHSGATSLTHLLLDNVDRIEVLKGPASSLYGSSAMGGVVNFITKRSSGPISGRLSVRTGSYETADFRAQLGGNLTTRIDADVAVRYVEAGHYDIAGLGEWGGTGYKSHSGSFRVGGTFPSGLRLDVKANTYFGRALNAPGSYSDALSGRQEKDLDHLGADIRLSGRIGTHAPQATVFASQEYQDTFRAPLGGTRYLFSIRETTFRGAQLQDAWAAWRGLTLTYGVDYLLVKNDTQSFNVTGIRQNTSPGDSLETYGIFLDAVFSTYDERLIFNAGIRYDDITASVRSNAYSPTRQSGSRAFETSNLRAGFVYKPFSAWRLHGTVGSGFVSPSAGELANNGSEIGGGQTRVLLGNPNLKAESATTWDVGLGWEGSAWSADLTYFHTDVKNKISTVVLINTPTYRESTYVNAETASHRGLEGELAADLGTLFGTTPQVWRVTTGFTYMIDRTENLPGGPADIRNVARFKLVGALHYKQGKWFGRVGSRYVVGQHDRDNSVGRIFTGGLGGTFRYPSFIVWDVSGGYQITPHHEIALQVDNALNRFYYEKADYPMHGRAAYARYTYRL